MTFRKLNLGSLALVAGLLVAPATENVALCAPKAGTAPLNLTEADFTIPTALRGTRWRVRFHAAAGGVSVKLTVNGRSMIGTSAVTTEEITLAPNTSRTTNHEFLNLTSVRGDKAAGAEITIEWELIGVAAAADGAVVLEGVCTSTSSVARYTMATFTNGGAALVRMADTETPVVGGLVVAAANGLGRMKQMADTGATVGRCQSSSFVAKDALTYVNCGIDPR